MCYTIECLFHAVLMWCPFEMMDWHGRDVDISDHKNHFNNNILRHILVLLVQQVTILISKQYSISPVARLSIMLVIVNKSKQVPVSLAHYVM